MEHFNWFTGVIVPYINFFLFLFLAVWLFKKPLSDFARKRKEDFEANVKEARVVKAEAEKQSQHLKDRLSKLDFEIEEIAASAKQTAESEALRIIANAKELAEHIKLEAQRIAKAELEAARQNLKKEIVENVTKIVSERLKKELTSEKQKQILKDKTKLLKEISFS